MSDAGSTCPVFPLVAEVVGGEIAIALDLLGLVRSGRVTEVTRDGAGGRYTLSARLVRFTCAGDQESRSTSLDEWERCVRECWLWARREAQRAG